LPSNRRLITSHHNVGLAAAGIGAHHAGLELSDKRLVEELFMNRVLRVVAATSVGQLANISVVDSFPYLV
jgi:superfamily II RNA helicase